MDVEHLTSLQTSAHSWAPTAVGGYKGSIVVATPGAQRSNHICLWQPLSSSRKLTLVGHCDPVSALALSSPSPPSPSSLSPSPPSATLSPSTPTTLLCSASSDALLLWDVEDCYQCTAAGGTPRSHPLPTPHRGLVSCLCFSSGAHWVAACVENETLVFQTESCSLDTTLVGHSAPVTCAVFSPHHSSTLVTGSQDRTFKIWNLAESSLVFQSSIVSASPFLCIAIDPQQAQLAIGAADGKLRVYDMSRSGVCQCLHEIDTRKELEKLCGSSPHDSEATTGPGVISSSSPWQQKQSCANHVTQVTPTTSKVENGPAILDIFYWVSDHNSSLKARTKTSKEAKPLIAPTYTHLTEEHISEVLREPPTLLAVTHMGLLRLRANTLELLEYIDFREPLFSTDPGGSEQHLVPAVASCSFFCRLADQEGPPTTQEVYCALGAMFHSTVSLLCLRSRDISSSGEKESAVLGQKAEYVISVLSSAPLVPDSALRAEFIPKAKPAATAKRQPGLKGRTQKGVVDQPLTFKPKVRSSGYTETPRTKMFAPNTSTSRHKTAPAVTKKSNANGSSVPRQPECYPVECRPTTHLSRTVQLSDRPAAINCASFSGSGQYLACASADKAAYLLKMPLSTGKTHIDTFVGHDGPVLSCSWSHDGHWLLTSSADRSARLWTPGSQDPFLTLASSLHNFREPAGASGNKPNPSFPREVTDARFYYLDKFILLTCGNTLYLYKYHIDTTKPDDIKRYQSNSRYKLVKTFAMESAQSITAMSCINDFHSYLVFMAGSNKALEVYDMNVGRVVRTFADVHTRPVTCIAQNKGSRYTTHPPDAYDLFLTSAITDGIKLWDLRTSRCLCRFTSHQNRSHHLSAAISPCTRFITTGSEDKAVYIYGLQSSSPLHRLTGHSDVVSTVTYHPLRPMLATSTIDGQVRFFEEVHVVR